MERYWDGRTVHVARTNPEHDRRDVDLALTRDAAGQLANFIRRQTGLSATFAPLTPELQEILNALDYVLVADPASIAAHRRMEAGKGMTPDGGYRTPLADHEFVNDTGARDGSGAERCGYAKSKSDASTFCWRKREEHPDGA